MATNNSNSLFHVFHHVKLFCMHEINEKSQQILASFDDKEQNFLSGNHGVFLNVQLLLALEIDIGYRLRFFYLD